MTPTSFIPSIQKLASIYGPVFELFIFRSRFLVLCDAPSIKEVMMKRPKVFRRDHAIQTAFAVIGIDKQSLFSAEGNTWSRLCRLLSAPFNKQSVDTMIPSVQVEIDNMIKTLRNTHGAVIADIGETMMIFTLRTILRVAFNNVDIDKYFANNQLLRDTNTLFSYITERTLYPFPFWVWRLLPPAIEKDAIERIELKKNKSDKALHAYALEDYGLCADDFQSASSEFKRYLSDFGF